MAKQSKRVTAADVPHETMGVVLESLARRISLELAGLRQEVDALRRENDRLLGAIRQHMNERGDMNERVSPQRRIEELEAELALLGPLLEAARSLAIWSRGHGGYTLELSRPLIEEAIGWAMGTTAKGAIP